ncbi:MAG: glycosyltransferase family 4 protein [Kiritimatiellae bacterium]|nr:glycosyltransferase family 4 protein [Kiritimatiellia bacterium]
MRVLFCVKHLVGRGGQEGYLRRLATFLVARGHQVEVICARADDIPGIRCTRVRLPAMVARPAWDWAAARAVVAESVRHPCDVSFGGQKMWGCNVLRLGGGVEHEFWEMRLTDRYRWAPLRAAARLMIVKRRFDLNAERRAFSDPALRRVVVNSDMVRRGLIGTYPWMADRVEVVYNGADIARFAPASDAAARTQVQRDLNLDPGLLTAVFAGFDYRRKGLPQALEALALLKRRDPARRTQMIVMGVKAQSGVARLVARLGLSGEVRLIGNTPCAEKYYAASDFLLFPTYYDPCANVTFEALASGLPVITTRRNGGSEIVADDREGWTVEHPDRIDEMAAHIEALHDRARLSRMQAAARRLAETHPLEDKLAAIEAVLVEAAREKDTQKG